MLIMRVLISGYTGKVGSEVYKYLQAQKDVEVVGGINLSNYHALESLLKEKPNFLVDFTTRDASVEIVKQAANSGVNCLIGTTGFSEDDLKLFEQLAEDKRVLIAWIPNFSLGANLMMEFSKFAADYFDEVEIVEMHHRKKLDKPSGTAKLTSEMIAERWKAKTIEGKLNISSLRLSSAVAHQWVVFGGDGELLVIEHHSLSRRSFAKGVYVALRKVHSDLDKFRGKFIKGLMNLLRM